MRTIRGNSRTPWPTATSAPALPSRLPLAIVTAVTGPGIITPERDMTITEARKTRIFNIKSKLQKIHPPNTNPQIKIYTCKKRFTDKTILRESMFNINQASAVS